MFKECKTERSAKRQRLIENTLFDMMKRRSYDDITVTDLCTRCHPDLFWSHRKTGDARGSLAAFIALTD